MSEAPSFKPEDVKKARFIREFIEETEMALRNLELPKKNYLFEKMIFHRHLLENPRCSRKRREDVEENIKAAKEEMNFLRDQARAYNNELEVYQRMYVSLPEALRNLVEKMPLPNYEESNPSSPDA